MQLLIIRHAIAEDPKEFALTGRPDDQRPLTDDGVEKMKRAVRGLRELVPELSLIATSPYVRAVETAKIVANAYKEIRTVIIHELVPTESGEAFAAWLRPQKGVPTIAIVGHEPHLSALTGFLMTGEMNSVIELKKGGAVMLDFAGLPGAGTGILEWAIPPRELRTLGAK
jgi:phosphohistidine phosphatase